MRLEIFIKLGIYLVHKNYSIVWRELCIWSEKTVVWVCQSRGTSVSWGHYCDLMYVTWRDFDQWHAHI